MSIIRVSCDRSRLFAPKSDGTLIDKAYSERAGEGKLEELTYESGASRLQRAPLLEHYLTTQLASATSQLRADASVLVMVHGFLFDPYHIITENPKDSDNAHGRLFHMQSVEDRDAIRHHTTSWPKGLGFANDRGQSGVALAFGWHSKPGLATSLLTRFGNIYARAYDYAEETAWCFAHTLHALASSEALAGRKIDIIAHSLGSRVVIRAIAIATKLEGRKSFLSSLGRVVLLGGSEYVVEAQLMYHRLLEGEHLAAEGESGPSFYNVGCRENDVLDKLGENFGPRTFGNHNVIGHNGLGTREQASHWLDLQIDSTRLRDWFRNRDGLDISGDQPGNVWDHWYYYTHAGNMELYKKLLRSRERFSIAALRDASQSNGAVPEGIEQGRWTGD